MARQNLQDLEPTSGRIVDSNASAQRGSCIFPSGESVPDQLKRDTSVHRLYHHYYEDLLS